ncbi:MAG: quinone-interacting membrane-bound oxidoreductase complex subunit QmoC [Candidatus Hydrogenedentota bacterium]|nr:MAG: quinone-interacting membrane-bound oxidoreductase complex subunit QmoC [Candidatus Hydrogenedentota bacterium]
MTTEQVTGAAEKTQAKSATIKVEPDLDFIRQVKAAGGDTLKKCFQCATCSVVCSITPENRPFPRKEMIWASWGLKDKLISDGDVWLCHQCNDCSVDCPRGAKPGDVLAAVRNYLFKTLTFPKFLGTWLGEPKYLPLVFAIPIVWIFLTVLAAGTLGEVHMGRMSPAEIKFEEFLPHPYLYSIFITATHLAGLFLIIGLVKYWKMLGTSVVSAAGSNPGGPTEGNVVASAIATVKEILTHTKFKKCEENSHRYLGHLGIMYGFLLLAVGTAIEIFMLYALGAELPLSQLSVPKILGHLGFIALTVGLILVIRRRLSGDESVSRTTYQDWYLLIVLLAVALSGQLLEIIRYTGIAWLAYVTYFVHLVLVFALIGYFPYSKFAHMFYRFVAILHSKYTGRDVLAEEAAA